MSTNNGISSDLEFQNETPTLKENFLIEGEENKENNPLAKYHIEKFDELCEEHFRINYNSIRFN